MDFIKLILGQAGFHGPEPVIDQVGPSGPRTKRLVHPWGQVWFMVVLTASCALKGVFQ